MKTLTRFSLRDMLWLTVVFSLALGWWLDHRKLSWQMDQADNAVQSLLTGQRVYRTLLDRHAPD